MEYAYFHSQLNNTFSIAPCGNTSASCTAYGNSEAANTPWESRKNRDEARQAVNCAVCTYSVTHLGHKSLTCIFVDNLGLFCMLSLRCFFFFSQKTNVWFFLNHRWLTSFFECR